MVDKIAQKGLPGVFDYLEHMADIYIVAYGRNILELYGNAGLSLFESMTDTSRVERVVEKRVVAEGFDLENLLYRWLEELLYIYYSENMFCGVVRADKLLVVREGGEVRYLIEGVCVGEKYQPGKHEARVEVKAVTYHMMRIVLGEDGWKAYFVLDI